MTLEKIPAVTYCHGVRILLCAVRQVREPLALHLHNVIPDGASAKGSVCRNPDSQILVKSPRVAVEQRVVIAAQKQAIPDILGCSSIQDGNHVGCLKG